MSPAGPAVEAAGDPPDDETGAVMVLATLPGMGPRHLRLLLSRWGPVEALAAVRSGRLAHDAALLADLGRAPVDRVRGWTEPAGRVHPDTLLARHRELGVTVLTPTHPDWPERFLDDPDPPAMLCLLGSPSVLAGPACAIVGTRACTPDGRRMAFVLGRDLAAAGVGVVSGLALGVDAAAHRGSLAARAAGAAAPTVGVVAGGVDVVYPPSHGDLFGEVAAGGAVLSEVPLGTRPDTWRFPARNRLVAALADVVVVVESPMRGGSLHTVDAALDRDRTVGAVPGPVGSPASAGTNQLLADHALLVRDADDVLVALGLGGTGPRAVPSRPPTPTGVDGIVHAAVGTTPTTLDDVVAASGSSVGAALAALHRLLAVDLVDDLDGRWVRRGTIR